MFGRISDWVVRHGIPSKGTSVTRDILLIRVLHLAGVYGPGGKYHGFAGKDASRAMAKWSMEEEDLNDDLVSKNTLTNELIANAKKLQHHCI